MKLKRQRLLRNPAEHGLDWNIVSAAKVENRMSSVCVKIPSVHTFDTGE